MTKTLTIILAFCTTLLLGQSSIEKDLSPNSSMKAKLDSARNPISPDLLPQEFSSPTLENEYYCTMPSYVNHVFVLRLRDNGTFFYEVYYNWARIVFLIGRYAISGDKIHFTKESLLQGKPNVIYLQPANPVSWSPPSIPKYLLIKQNQLIEKDKSKDLFRTFINLDSSSHFDLKKVK